jgi:hypothetical protein
MLETDKVATAFIIQVDSPSFSAHPAPFAVAISASWNTSLIVWGKKRR